GAETIQIRGSWVLESGAKTNRNTVELSCDKNRHTCLQASAIKNNANGYLGVTAIEYQIKKWSPEQVIATIEGPAERTRIHICRLKQVVTSAPWEKPVNSAARLPIYAHLDDDGKSVAGKEK